MNSYTQASLFDAPAPVAVDLADRLMAQAARAGFYARLVDGDCLLLWRDGENPDDLLALGFRDAQWFLGKGENES